jgi:sigma-B regulation protein RsbU (phosphoserine phosphatase)
MMEDLPFGTLTTTLAPGDALMFFSDGVNEAMNEAQELFSVERTGEFLKEAPKGSAEELTNAVVAEVKRYTGTAPQADDITVLVVRYLGAGA